MAPFKSNELKSDWRSDFLIEETDCDCEGCGQDPCIKCGESHHNINEEVQGGVSVETYTKDTKFTEIETVDIIKAKPLVSEGNRTRYKGVGLSGSGNKKDYSKGPNEKVFVDYSKIQAKAPTNQGKKTVDPKKNEVISASNELEGEQSLVEEVLVEDFMTNLYNEGYSVDEINEYLLEEYEIDEEYLEEVWGILAKGALKGAKLLSKGAGYAAKRAVKDSGKVAKFAKNPKNWSRANKDLDKVGGALVKGAKDTKELAARTYAAGQKARKLVDASGKNLLGPAKSFKQLTASIKKVKQTGDRAIVRQQVKGNLPASNPKIQAAADRYSAKVDLPKIKWNSTVPKGGTATKLKVEPKVTKVKSLKPASSSPEPKVTKVKVDKRKGKIGNPWNQFPKKRKPQLGLPKKENVVDRTNKLLPATKSPAGALPASKTAGSLPPGKKGGPISKAQSTSVVSSPGGKVVQSKGGKLTKEVKPNERKLSAVEKLKQAKRGSEGKGTTYTSKGVRQLPSGDDPTKVKVAAASLGLGSYAGVKISQKTGLIGKKEKEVKEGIALAVPAGIGLGKTALKVGGAVLAAKGGEKGMKKIMDVIKRARKDDVIGRELDVKQNQAKDAAKNKPFDDEMSAFRKAKEAGNLSSDEIKTQLKKNAQIKKDLNPKVKKESFSNWRSDLEVVDESAKVMLKIGKRVWKSPGVKKFLSKVPSNLSRATKIKPITKSHALTKQTKSFGVRPLESGRKAGERLAPDRTTLKLDSNMGRPKPKNMALNTETGDYVPKLKKSNYELVPGAKYGDKVMAKNYGQELKDKEIRKQIEALRKARNPKGIKDKSDTNQAALKTLKKSDSHK